MMRSILLLLPVLVLDRAQPAFPCSRPFVPPPQDTCPTTERVSVDPAGVQGNSGSGEPTISPDGRFVLFGSGASNLVPGDTNNAEDVFVHDRQTGKIRRVSVDSAGVQGNDYSYPKSISANGRFVAFESSATNLVPGDTNDRSDIFVHDCQTGQTARVSVDSAAAQGNGTSRGGSISADGRFVAFYSFASNLVPGDTNDVEDVFVHDRQTGQTARVSVDSAGVQGDDRSQSPSISADGLLVAFHSLARNLVTGDSNGYADVFVHDRPTGQTTRVSVDSAGGQGNDDSDVASISADGRCVAFQSLASNLVAGIGAGNVFVHDRQTGQTTPVSVDSAGAPGDRLSSGPSISAEGQFVTFRSLASNLVPGDSNGSADIFMHDRLTGETARVSVHTSGGQGNDDSLFASIAAKGRFVAFQSHASNLVPEDTNDSGDVFVRDRGSIHLTLALQGSCPGRIRFVVSGATPQGRVAFVAASGTGSIVIPPGGQCAGVTLALDSSATKAARTSADANGNAVLDVKVPAAACGQVFVQVIDVSTCCTSNVVGP